MNKLLILSLTCLLFLLGLTDAALSQVKKKPDEAVKDKKLAGILKDLKHKNAKERVAALQQLAQMADVRPSDVTPALPYVLPMLRDTDAGVRRAAITLLDTLEADPKDFVPPLVEILKKEKDAGVRLAAVTAAGHIGPPAAAAVPALEAILKSVKDNPKEKVFAAAVNAALQRIKKKQE